MTDTNAMPLVLIVDDDFTMRLLMRETLEQSGFQVIEAQDGEPALAIYQEQRPNIILLDVMMPNMDGFSVCKILRTLPECAHIPILLVTGLDDMESINRAYEAGATDFLTKPITWPLLGHRVRYVLRASEAMAKVGQSEASLAHAQSIAHLGNWEWQLDENNVVCSQEVSRIIGQPWQQLSKDMQGFLPLIHPTDRPIVEQCWQKAREQGIAYSVDHRILRPDGSERIVHQQAEIISNTQGQVVQINGTIQDITERKQAENELKQYRNHLEELVEQRTAELTQTNAKLQEAKEQAEQANSLKDKFVSLVAHDLRSPLAGIITALDFIYTDTDAPLHEEHQEIVGRLINIGKSLVQMIEDVLNIGRLKSGKIRPNLEVLPGKALVDKVIKNLSYLAKQKGVELCNELPDHCQWSVDPALFGEVVQNLTSNGIKFCVKGDHIRFYQPPADKGILAVADTGTGIAPEVIPKLFKVEEKTSTPGTSGEQGTGFGLPFSQDIMHAHGGEIRVESQPGQGSTFFLYLPPTKNIPQSAKP